MSIALEAVCFNCQPARPGITALNLRKNASAIVPLPEWQAGFSVSSLQSLAAYTTSSSWGRSVLIQARFRRTAPGLPAVQVRAVPPSATRASLEAFERLLPEPASLAGTAYAEAWRRQLDAEDHVLGAIQPRWIALPSSGETGFETFELPDHRLWSAGVGIHTVVWRWQLREATTLPWRDFAVTRHRIYTMLDTPTAPWSQAPFVAANTQLPWTDVLEYACRWSAGARTRQTASAAITSAVFGLGPAVVQYGCPIFALSQYSLFYFDCTAFLERLQGGFGNGPYVNCSDCATIVSSFANILGCDLWQSRMAPLVGGFFATNPIRVIGYPEFGVACGFSVGFQYHEVAWLAECGLDDPVCDACLLLNRAPNPALPPYVPWLAVNLPFVGAPGRDYRSRLVAPLAQSNCVPQPLARQRRYVV